ncbi:purple acid phosphatase 3 [Penicillium atrosanguineum]|nr:purple acid phosphatase 3 [Penicillium atrosanguineum]
MSHIPHVALTLSLALGAAAARNSIVASKGAETLAVGIFGALIHHSYTYLRIQSSLSDKNDCDPGDRQDISNPTIEETHTAHYIQRQEDTSVYSTDYVIGCHKDTQEQVNFLRESFAKPDATWKNNGAVVNGHDHFMAHYQYEGTDFVLTGGAGYAEAGDCN